MSDLAYREQGKKRDSDQIEEFYERLKQMETTITQLCKQKDKQEMRHRTDSKLRTKQNTRLIVWNNRLKEENMKQKVTLQLKQEGYAVLEEDLATCKREEAKVRRQFNEMTNQRGNQSGRASSAASRRGDSADDRMAGKKVRTSSATRIQAGDGVREEEQDKSRIEQLKRQIEMNNVEILDNWEQIAIIKRNIFDAVQARQHNLTNDPSGGVNQLYSN